MWSTLDKYRRLSRSCPCRLQHGLMMALREAGILRKTKCLRNFSINEGRAIIETEKAKVGIWSTSAMTTYTTRMNLENQKPI